MQQFFKLFLIHKDLTWLGPLFITDHAFLCQLIHYPGSTVEADLQQSLQCTYGCFFLIYDKSACLGKQLIIFRFSAGSTALTVACGTRSRYAADLLFDISGSSGYITLILKFFKMLNDL